MNNKQTLIVLINIFLIVILLFFAELTVFYTEIKNNNIYQNASAFKFIKNKPSLGNYQKIFREPLGTEYKKAPVLIYGCSFAHGVYLKDNERPDYILSQLTQRPVYNFSVPGEGLQQALYIMQNQEKINPAPEYVIYIFHSDHIRRLFVQSDIFHTEKFLQYKINNNKIIFDTDSPHFIENTYLYRKISQVIFPPHSEYYSSDYAYRRFKIFVHNMNDEIHKKYPDSKFIFVFYDTNSNCITSEQLFDFIKMENSKFKIICLPFILDEFFYKNPDSYIWDKLHPSGRAWKIVIPEIVKRM